MRQPKPKRMQKKDSYHTGSSVFNAVKDSKELSKIEKTVISTIERLSKRNHTIVPHISFHRGKGSTSSHLEAYYDNGKVKKAVLTVGVRNYNPTRMDTTLRHEMGHLAHMTLSKATLAKLGVKKTFNQADKLEREQIAWQIAFPVLSRQSPAQRGIVTRALKTYTRVKTKARGRKSHGKKTT